MANTEWHSLFPNWETEFLEFSESDHRPLITHMSCEVEEKRGTKEGFCETVSKGWRGQIRNRTLNTPLYQRIAHCRKQISNWKRRHRTNAEERINIIRAQH